MDEIWCSAQYFNKNESSDTDAVETFGQGFLSSNLFFITNVKLNNV